MKPLHVSPYHGGTSLIEVLVTIVILALGLLGLVGLQSRLQISEVEAYQRAQALILLNDMANRISANRSHADDYVDASPLGSGMTCPTSTSSRSNADAAEWCNALQGASELSSTNTRIGAMVGALGCVEDGSESGEYVITVAWQGMAPISAPPENLPCGAGNYDGEGGCINDLCRRVVSTTVRLGNL